MTRTVFASHIACEDRATKMRRDDETMSDVRASMAGTVFQVLVAVGDSVQAGQDVVVLESMKMEVPVTSESSGTVREVRIAVGDFVNEEDVLVVLD